MTEKLEEKRKVLKEIITSEENILHRLKRLVDVAKPFLKVEEKSGRVIFDTQFTITERIFLLLLGKYFAMHYGILKDCAMRLRDISAELGIKRTTLSPALKRLMKNGVVERPEKNTYKLNIYKAEYFLQQLAQKVFSKKSGEKHDN